MGGISSGTKPELRDELFQGFRYHGQLLPCSCCRHVLVLRREKGQDLGGPEGSGALSAGIVSWNYQMELLAGVINWSYQLELLSGIISWNSSLQVRGHQ